MLKQLQERGTSLSGYKALPPPPREATARALLVENKDKGYPPPHVCFFDALDIKTIYSRNNMYINVVLCLSYAWYDYLECGMF